MEIENEVSKMKKLLKFILKLLLFIFIVGAIITGYIVYDGYNMYQEAIQKKSITEAVQQIEEKKDYLKFDDIPKDFSNAIVAVEDHRFYRHHGVDIRSIGRAIVTNVKAMKLVEGGSTITQQLAKNMYFTFEKKFSRKVAEVFVAMDLEKNYSKEEILSLYINMIYFGDGYYGLQEAAKGYFSKVPSKLTFDEITLLAGLPNAPSAYALSSNSSLAKERQDMVKDAMKRYQEYLK